MIIITIITIKIIIKVITMKINKEKCRKIADKIFYSI